MNALIRYINSFPLNRGVKFVATAMTLSDKHIFTREWMMQNFDMSYNTANRYKNHMMQCGIIAEKENEELDAKHYFIADIRLQRHVAAYNNNHK